MNTQDARAFARQINEAVLRDYDKRAAWADCFARLKTMSQEDRDLVHKFQMLEIEAEKRAARRADRERGNRDAWKEPGNAQNIRWMTRTDREDGERVTFRYFVEGELGARQLYRQLAPDQNHSAYSPTGRWFRTAPHIKHVRGEVWQVISARCLDC